MRRTGKRKTKAVSNTGYSRQVLRWLGRVTLASMVLAGAVFVVTWVSDPTTLPIRSVRVEGTFKYLDVEQLQKVVESNLEGGFFDLDIQSIQDAVKTLGWVDQVSVRRIWPDTVSIRVTEHVPLARWKKSGLINKRGEWFDVAQDQSVKMLPEFSGPEGRSLKLTEHYRDIMEILNPVGLDIALLTMDQRRTWEISLSNGINIKLGKSEIESRLKRFVRIYPLLLEQLSAGLSLEGMSSMGSLANKVGAIDLRYTNGFSIRWQRELKKSGLLHRGTEKNV